MLSLPLEALNPVEIVADLEVTGWTLVELAAKGGLPGHLAEPLSHWLEPLLFIGALQVSTGEGGQDYFDVDRWLSKSLTATLKIVHQPQTFLCGTRCLHHHHYLTK